jgi:hypothetical protein
MSHEETNSAPSTHRLELLRSAPLNSWVALSPEEDYIVATGATFIEAEEAARKSGVKGYFLTKTPDSWVPRALNAA